VTVSGRTSCRSIDPTETGLSVPDGYTIEPNQPAYNISTTATTTGDIDVCLQSDGEYSYREIFSLYALKIAEIFTLCANIFSKLLILLKGDFQFMGNLTV